MQQDKNGMRPSAVCPLNKGEKCTRECSLWIFTMFLSWSLNICKIAYTTLAQVCCLSECSWLCTSHICWMTSRPIISFKPPSHTIIQFPLLDNNHVILIWQVDYSIPHKTANAEEMAGAIVRAFKVGWAGIECLRGLLFPLMFSTTGFVPLIWRSSFPTFHYLGILLMWNWLVLFGGSPQQKPPSGISSQEGILF